MCSAYLLEGKLGGACRQVLKRRYDVLDGCRVIAHLRRKQCVVGGGLGVEELHVDGELLEHHGFDGGSAIAVKHCRSVADDFEDAAAAIDGDVREAGKGLPVGLLALKRVRPDKEGHIGELLGNRCDALQEGGERPLEIGKEAVDIIGGPPHGDHGLAFGVNAAGILRVYGGKVAIHEDVAAAVVTQE